jgi:hypothetical protein
MKEAAVVTFAMGNMKYRYEKLFIPSIKAYAKKWNFDFYCIDQLFDSNISLGKSDFKTIVCMEKLLISKQSWAQDYKYIIYIDADILINYEKAPNILEGIPEGKIGVVDERIIWGNDENAKAFFAKYSPYPSAEDYYTYLKFPKTFNKQFNAGLFVFQPSIHKDFFEEIYNKYMPKILDGENFDYDQGLFNFEGNSRDLVYYLDERFNRIWIIVYNIFYPFLKEKTQLQEALKTIFDKSYCIHFAAGFGWDLLE